MGMKSDLVDVSVLLWHKALKAILVKEDEDGKDIWLPLSQIEFDPPDALPRTVITVTLPKWIAKDKGLI